MRRVLAAGTTQRLEHLSEGLMVPLVTCRRNFLGGVAEAVNSEKPTSEAVPAREWMDTFLTVSGLPVSQT